MRPPRRRLGRGRPAHRDALNLESRLAQRVLWPVADGPYRDEHDLYELARASTGRSGSRREQTCAWTSRAALPLQSLNFAALRIKDAVCDVLREATGERPSVDTRHPDLPLCCSSGPSTPRCTSTPRARRCSSAAGAPGRQGRGAAEGDAGRRHAGRRRLAGPRRGRPAARPLLRRRHHRHRGRADRLRHRPRGCSAASPSSASCPSAPLRAPGSS
jgi:hypothetical protein